MRQLLALLALAAAAPLAAEVPFKAPLGAETVILFAGNGGIRDYQAGEPNILYLQDRRYRWYRVQLNRGCVQSGAQLGSLLFKTDYAGTFDRFSTIRPSRYPGRVCGVTSIRSSLPPQGQPGAPAIVSHRR